jgi:nitrogen fixation/metabolism regulation signal transduction histidine kinase
MIGQLAAQRTELMDAYSQLDSRRRFTEAVLSGVSAGVIGLDEQGRIELPNRAASELLEQDMMAAIGRPLAEAVPEFEPLMAIARSAPDRPHTAEVRIGPPNRRRTLLVRIGADRRGSSESGSGEFGFVATFDDITELQSAQRKAAWADVARRIAHEIKNPLTPIQLSAERLQLKLEDKLEEPSRQLLDRSVNTIVTQVQALKTLINEFRDYARLPSARLTPLDLSALIHDVTTLSGHAIESGVLYLDLQEPLPAILGDATLLRQVVHNLVQNALDAVTEHPPEGCAPCVRVRTHTSLDEAGQVRAVRLVVRDNGPGFSEKILKRAFEPYITTKAKGTGLGLAVVKKIADEHGALIRLRNVLPSAEMTLTQRDNLGYPAAIEAMSGAQVSISFSKLSSQTAQAGSH